MAHKDFDKEFLTSGTGLEGYEDNWTGVRILGSGSYGTAGLWVKIDPATQKIVDRMVIKNCFLGLQWDDQGYWAGPDNKTPREVYMSQLVNCENNVRTHAFTANERATSYRVYMEFCGKGNLYELWESYRQQDKALPEPFLWKVFEDLAVAADAMDNPVGEGLNKGSYVVHMDIKGENIFLAAPSKYYFPKYPVAKVGDFGASILTDPNDHKNPRFYRHNVITPTYVPPEVHQTICPAASQWVPGREDTLLTKFSRLFGPEKHLEKFTSTTNIWAIGVVMAELLCNNFPECYSFEGRGGYAGRERWINQFLKRKNHLPRNYSTDLMETITECLRYYPEDRPSAKKLLKAIQWRMLSHIDVMGNEKCLKPKNAGRHELMDSKYKLQDKWHVGGDIPPPSQPPAAAPKPPGPQGPPGLDPAGNAAGGDVELQEGFFGPLSFERGASAELGRAQGSRRAVSGAGRTARSSPKRNSPTNTPFAARIQKRRPSPRSSDDPPWLTEHAVLAEAAAAQEIPAAPWYRPIGGGEGYPGLAARMDNFRPGEYGYHVRGAAQRPQPSERPVVGGGEEYQIAAARIDQRPDEPGFQIRGVAQKSPPEDEPVIFGGEDEYPALAARVDNFRPGEYGYRNRRTEATPGHPSGDPPAWLFD